MNPESLLPMICAYPHHALLSNHILLLMLWRPEQQDGRLTEVLSFDEAFFARIVGQVDEKSPSLAHTLRKRLDVFRLGAGSLVAHQDYFRDISQALVSELPTQEEDSEVKAKAVAVESFLSYLEDEGLSETTRSCPKELVHLLTQITGKGRYTSIYDPRCNTGHLLAGFANNFAGHMSGVGQSKNETDIFHAQLRAYGASNVFLIEMADAFQFPPAPGGHLQTFDIVVSDLSDGVDAWPQDICEADPFGRFRFGLPSPAKGELALVQHMLSTMHSHDGIAMVVVDQSVLMRSGRDAEIRKAFIESNLLDTVIFLPQKLYRSDARSAVILLFKAMRANTDVLIINGTKEISSSKSLNKLTADGIQKISEHFAHRTPVDNQAVLISSAEFQSNDYVVSMSRFFPTQSRTAEIDLDSLSESRKAMDRELFETSRAIDSLIESLNIRS